VGLAQTAVAPIAAALSRKARRPIGCVEFFGMMKYSPNVSACLAWLAASLQGARGDARLDELNHFVEELQWKK
jgi:hypothetical protein